MSLSPYSGARNHELLPQNPAIPRTEIYYRRQISPDVFLPSIYRTIDWLNIYVEISYIHYIHRMYAYAPNSDSQKV